MPESPHTDDSQTIAVAGASGVIGSALVPMLTEAGHTVRRLVRREPRAADEIRWSPSEGQLDISALAGVDAVVNLAGEPIVGRWTEAKRQRIRDSRVNSTRLLAEALARLAPPRPRVLVNASGINYYGNPRGDVVDETSPAGDGFLARTCQVWEAAAQPAVEAGVRTVFTRLGMVLSPDGGALAQMLPIFRTGLAGPLGSGKQWWSWVAIDDAVGAIAHALFADASQSQNPPVGPMNVVAPTAVTNRTFTRTLGRVIHRPTLIPAPRFALHLAFGEMADETMFVSARVQPKVLHDTGFVFACPELEPALHHLLDR